MGRPCISTPARLCDFLQQLQADLPCPVSAAKIIRFAANPNHAYNSRHPVPRRGALAIVTNVGAGCGGRGSVRRVEVFAGRLSVSEHRAQTNGAYTLSPWLQLAGTW